MLIQALLQPAKVKQTDGGDLIRMAETHCINNLHLTQVPILYLQKLSNTFECPDAEKCFSQTHWTILPLITV
jgi:hypothetical protein